MSDGEDCRMINEQFTKNLNRNLEKGEALSDDEVISSPGKSGSKKDLDSFNNQLSGGGTTKKVPGSSMNVVKMEGIGGTFKQGPGGGTLGQGLDFGDLTSKLEGVNEEEEENERKKAEFE